MKRTDIDTADATPTTDAITAFRELNRMAVDRDGIRIPHMVARVGDGLHVYAMAGLSPHQSHVNLCRVLVGERPDEIVFGLDRWTRPGQGVITESCLSVAHWTLGVGWRFGVIAYTFDPPMFDAIDWHNPHWTAAMIAELRKTFGNIHNAPNREPSPAMTLPLQLADGGDPEAAVPAGFSRELREHGRSED